MIADKNYFLDANGDVTTDASNAAQLLVYTGGWIDDQTAARYGFATKASRSTKDDPKEEPEAELKSEPIPESVEVKRGRGAKENKSE